MGKRKDRPFETLSVDEIEWLKNNYNRFSQLEIEEVLCMDNKSLFKVLDRLGLKLDRKGFTKQDKTTVYSAAVTYENRIQDGDIFAKKIEKVKRNIRPGMKIGPYIVKRVYSYHCTVISEAGYLDSLSYRDLAKFLK